MVKSGEDEVLAITRDITDRKHAEQEIVRQRDFLTHRREHGEEHLLRRHAGRPRSCASTPSASELTGRADDEHARGRLFWELFAAPEDADAVREAFEADVAGLEHEHRWISASGRAPARGLVDHAARRRDGRGAAAHPRRRRHRAEAPGGGAAPLAHADRRGRGRRAPAARAEPPRRRAAAARLALARAAARAGESSRRTRAAPRRSSTARRAELAHALEELRELARGIHPAILTDRGLAAALEALAARAPLPVEIDALPDRRLPEQVEAAAFYVVSEALTNVAKYAQASFARVSVTCEDGHAIVEVATTASAAPTPRAAPACAASPTASRRSTGASWSRARPGKARSSGPSSRFAPAAGIREARAA